MTFEDALEFRENGDIAMAGAVIARSRKLPNGKLSLELLDPLEHVVETVEVWEPVYNTDDSMRELIDLLEKHADRFDY